jgi:hypothetical protein
MDVTNCRGMTTTEVAAIRRTPSDRIRTMIRSDKLGAVNMPNVNGKPRFIVMPEHLAAFTDANRRCCALEDLPQRVWLVDSADSESGKMTEHQLIPPCHVRACTMPPVLSAGRGAA